MSELAAPGTVLPRAPRAEAPSEPYPGLEPFRFADSGIFAARDAEVERLVRLITMYRGVMLYGESGAGKSSVVNAGLLPRILEDGFWPHRVRVQPRAGQELVLDPVRLSWQSDEILPSAFDGAVSDGQAILAAAKLEQAVERATQHGSILLVFDQFEELITLFDGDAEALACQARVLDAVLRLLRNPTLPVKLLFVFREDYLAALDPLIAEKPELTDQALRLVPPPVECATQIIRAPFERFHGAFERELSPEVAVRVAAALRTRSRAGALNLSELQVVCARLWAAPDAGELLDTQGVEGLLEDFLNARLATFDADAVGDLAVALLTRLVTVSGTRNVVSHEDLLAQGAEETGRTRDLAASVLKRLEHEAHLVRSERRRDVLTYEIVSEFLVPFIAARKAEREAAREAREALEAARAAHTRELASRRRVLLWAGGAVALLAVLAFAALAAYALDRRSAAIRDRDVASANELSSAADTQKTNDPALARALGLRALGMRWTPTAESALRTAVSIPVAARTVTLAGDPAAGSSGANVTLSEDGRYATAVVGTEARVWDAHSGAIVRKVPGIQTRAGAELSHDGRLLLVAVGDAVEVIDVAGSRPPQKFPLPPAGLVFAFSFSPDAELVVARGTDNGHDRGFRRVWRLADGARVDGVPPPPVVPSVQLGPDGTLFGDAYSPGITVLDLRRNRDAWRAPDMSLVGFDMTGGNAAIARQGRLEIRHAQSGRLIRRISQPGFTALSARFAADGSVLVAEGMAGNKRVIEAWSVRSARRLGPAIGEGTGGADEYAVSADGRLVATSTAGDVVVWDPHTGVPVAKLRGNAGPVGTRATQVAAAAPVAAVAAPADAAPADVAPAPAVAAAAPAVDSGGTLIFTSPDSLTTLSADGRISTWDVAAARARWARRDHSGQIWSAEFSPANDRLATGGSDGGATVITVASGQPRFTVRPPNGGGEMYVAKFNPAGDRLATITDRGAVDVWNAFDGRHVRRLRRASATFYTATVTFSPDGARVLAAFGRNVREWQVADGRQLRTQRSADDVGTAVYGPSGPVAVADTVTDTVRIGDLKRSKPQRVLRTGEGSALALAYSRYGHYLAAGTESGAAVIWDTRSGRRAAVLDGGSSRATAVQFTGDGRHLLVADDGGTVRLWDWRPQTSSVLATGFSNGWSVAMSSDRRLLTGTGNHATTLLLRCPGCAPLNAVKATAHTGARELTGREERDYLHRGQPQQQDPY